jgi:branched-subunit amino acid transport protein
MCWQIKYLHRTIYLTPSAPMGFLDAANHLLNFAAPAAFVALLVSYFPRFLLPKRPVVHAYWTQAAINFVVCVVVLSIGLWLFGQDGKMATYVAMVLASATVQWVVLKGWKK